MPFHEITLAVCSEPTRPMPHMMQPVATQLSPMPSASRATSITPTEATRDSRNKAAAISSSPLNAHATRPISAARLGPAVSEVRPAKPRLNKVATYCVLITRPASTAPKPRSSCTNGGSTASCMPITR